MICKICNQPVTEKGAVLAVPVVVSWRKSGNLTALSFCPWDDKLSKRPGVDGLCGVGCANIAVDRYLHAGHIEKPMTEAALQQIAVEQAEQAVAEFAAEMEEVCTTETESRTLATE